MEVAYRSPVASYEDAIPSLHPFLPSRGGVVTWRKKHVNCYVLPQRLPIQPLSLKVNKYSSCNS